MRISINQNQSVKIEDSPFETVERKGVGHPDTLCDAIAEAASRNYSKKVYEMAKSYLLLRSTISTAALVMHYLNLVQLKSRYLKNDLRRWYGRIHETIFQY